MVRVCVSLIVGTGNVEGKCDVRFALFADCACRVLTDIASCARLDSHLEGLVAVGTEEISTAGLVDWLAVFEPRHC